MKWHILILIGALLVGCETSRVGDLEKRNANLMSQLDSMRGQAELKNQFIEQYTQTVNDVYTNLERIRKREGLHLKMTRDLESNTGHLVRKEELLSNVESIDSYLQDSKRKTARLKRMLNDSHVKAVTMDSAISQLSKIVEAKELELTALRDEIEDISFRFTVVQAELEESSRVIEDQFNSLNSAWYVIGNEKELKEKGIIVEKGGILGIRQTKKLADDFSTEHFMPTSIRETGEIVIDEDVKDIKIISPHASDSFHLVGVNDDQTILEIIDAQEFWKIKYLVILKG